MRVEKWKETSSRGRASFSLMVFREDGSFEEVVWRNEWRNPVQEIGYLMQLDCVGMK